MGVYSDLVCFSVCWNIYLCFGGARFLGQIVKKGFFGKKTRYRQFGLITEKFFFDICFYFSCCFSKKFFLEGWKVRWGGPSGPPHLALNPLYCICFFLFCFILLLFPFRVKKRTVLPPPQKGHFLFLFSVFHLFLSSFSSSLFFHTLSLYLLFFFPSLFCCFVFYFVSLFLFPCLFALYFCFCFMKWTTSNY